MALVQDRCICLRKVEYSETSQILLLFSREHGLQRVIAKGAHRRTKAGASKFDGGIDLLDVGHAVFSLRAEKELGTLTEWKLLEWHEALHQQLRRMYLSLYAAELVGLLVEEHDPHRDLFDRLEAGLAEFGTERAEERFLAFELDLLREVGYMPELMQCANCGGAAGGREACFFSPSLGGVCCRNCHLTLPDRIAMDPRLLSMLQGILRLPRDASSGIVRLPRLTRHQTDPINRILAAHVRHILSRDLRMMKHVL